MKTNVSIKFNSIEEYKEIEKKLIELGYINDDSTWNNYNLKLCKFGYVYIDKLDSVFSIYKFGNIYAKKTYNSLQEFLNENEN